MMNNNPVFMNMLSMIKNGGNPQQLVLSFLQSSAGNNPMLSNLLSMVQSGDKQGVEQIARNLVSSQGLDFDTEFRKFAQNLGI